MASAQDNEFQPVDDDGMTCVLEQQHERLDRTECVHIRVHF